MRREILLFSLVDAGLCPALQAYKVQHKVFRNDF
jgi:hypothetical protein